MREDVRSPQTVAEVIERATQLGRDLLADGLPAFAVKAAIEAYCHAEVARVLATTRGAS